MKVRVTSATLIDYACVEVVGKMGRQNAEFVVHFSWRGEIKDGYRFMPDESYLAAAELPDSIKSAAIAVYDRRMDKDTPKFVLR